MKGGRIESNGQVVSVPMPTDSATGITGFDTGTGGFAGGIAIDRAGRFLYTTDVQTASFGMPIGSNGIGAFTIDRSSGVLNRIAGSPYLLATRPTDIAINGSGQFVYISVGSSIDIWSVNQANGVLTHVGSTTGGGAQLATTWDGHFLLSNAGGTVTSYAINQSNGQLTPVSAVAVATSNGMSLNMSNQFVYSFAGNMVTGIAFDANGPSHCNSQLWCRVATGSCMSRSALTIVSRM